MSESRSCASSDGRTSCLPEGTKKEKDARMDSSDSKKDSNSNSNSNSINKTRPTDCRGELIAADPTIQMWGYEDFETFRKSDTTGVWTKIVEINFPSSKYPKIEDGDDKARERARRMRVERVERFIALRWPRNPDGEVIMPGELDKGKVTPNGELTSTLVRWKVD